MDHKYGLVCAALLRGRIADIRAASCLGDVPMLDLSTAKDGVSLRVGTDLSIVFRANHRKPPETSDGKIDWARVDRILFQRIECGGD